MFVLSDELSILLVTGYGDVAYNLRRSILGALCVGKKTAYHLFMINDNFSAIDDAVAAKFCLKSKWRAQYNNNARNLDRTFLFIVQ